MDMHSYSVLYQSQFFYYHFFWFSPLISPLSVCEDSPCYCHMFVFFPDSKGGTCYCETGAFHFKWLFLISPSFLQMKVLHTFCEQIKSITNLYHTVFIQLSTEGTSVDLMTGLLETVQQ